MAGERDGREGGSCGFPRTWHPNEQDQESQLLIGVVRLCPASILREQTPRFISSARGVGQTHTDGAPLAAYAGAYTDRKQRHRELVNRAGSTATAPARAINAGQHLGTALSSRKRHFQPLWSGQSRQRQVPFCAAAGSGIGRQGTSRPVGRGCPQLIVPLGTESRIRLFTTSLSDIPTAGSLQRTGEGEEIISVPGSMLPTSRANKGALVSMNTGNGRLFFFFLPYKTPPRSFPSHQCLARTLRA